MNQEPDHNYKLYFGIAVIVAAFVVGLLAGPANAETNVTDFYTSAPKGAGDSMNVKARLASVAAPLVGTVEAGRAFPSKANVTLVMLEAARGEPLAGRVFPQATARSVAPNISPSPITATALGGGDVLRP